MKTWTLRSLAFRLAVAGGVLAAPHLALDPGTARPSASATTSAVVQAGNLGTAATTRVQVSLERSRTAQSTTQSTTRSNQRKQGAKLALRPTQVRVATLNLPGHVGGRKRNLLRHPRRTNRALEILNAQRIDVVALQELATTSRRTIRSRPNWALAMTRVNHVVRRNAVGNGVAFRSDRWRRVSIANLHLPMAGRRLGLNMPAVLLAHRQTGARLAVLSVHNPTKSHGPAIRRAAKNRQKAFARAMRARNIPYVIAGDFNQPNLQVEWRPVAGLTLGVKHRIDYIFGGNVQFQRRQRALPGVRGRVSDHPAVAVTARIPRTRMVQSLPRF